MVYLEMVAWEYTHGHKPRRTLELAKLYEKDRQIAHI